MSFFIFENEILREGWAKKMTDSSAKSEREILTLQKRVNIKIEEEDDLL